MNHHRRLQILVSLLLVLGTLPVAVAPGSWVYAVALGVALPLGWWVGCRPRQRRWTPYVLRLVLFAVTTWFVVEWFVLGTAPVLSIAHYLVLLCSVKLFERRGTRDLSLLFLVSLVLLIIAGIISAELIFPICLTGFILLSPYTAVLLHGRHQQELADAAAGVQTTIITGGAPADANDRLRGVCTAIAAVALACGITLLVFFPRLAARGVPTWLGPTARRLTGFSPDTNLSNRSGIGTSNKVVMQVWASLGEDVLTLDEYQPHLRGITRNHYVLGGIGPARNRRGSYYTWISDSYSSPRTVRDSPDEEYWSLLLEMPHADDERRHIRLDIELETRVAALFAPYPASAVYSEELLQVTQDGADQTLTGRRPRRRGAVAYSLLAPSHVSPEILAALTRERGTAPEPRPPEPQQIPVSDAVRQIALQLWAQVGEPDIDEPEDRLRLLRALAEYLRGERFTYSLEPVDHPPRIEPVEHFLTSSRTGHCEVYATTMAVLAQVLGIPARYVAGYYPAEYNAVAECYVVRERDAHAWVEAFVPGRDWVTFDPTPAAAELAARAGVWQRLQDYFDYFKWHWISAVVSFNPAQPLGFVDTVRDWFAGAGDRPAADGPSGIAAALKALLLGPPGFSLGQRVLYWFFVVQALLLAAVLARWLYRTGRRVHVRLRPRRRPSSGAPFYDRLERLLTRVGFERRLGQTPHEYVRHAAGARPQLAPGLRVVELFYAVRFGGRALTAHDHAEISRLLDALRAACRCSP